MLPPNDTEWEEIIRTVFGHDVENHATQQAFGAYLRHYNVLVCPNLPASLVLNVSSPALQNHYDILRCLKAFRERPQSTLDEFVERASILQDAGVQEKEHVANLIINIIFMVDCGLRNYHSDEFKVNYLGSDTWDGATRFDHFVKRAFESQCSRVSSRSQQSGVAVKHKKALKAWKLSRRCKINIKATSNLLEHLQFDPGTRSLKVFHHVSFLRAQMKRTKDEPFNLGLNESLERGTLPPKLLFETLLTFHHVLFPIATISDKRSHRLLRKLVQKEGFDPESQWIEYVREYPSEMVYEYWGGRLETLYNVVKRPPPTNAVVAWFERHTSERNALTVAILGLFLAVIFGFLSVIIGILQLVVAWLAWKYP